MNNERLITISNIIEVNVLDGGQVELIDNAGDVTIHDGVVVRCARYMRQITFEVVIKVN